MMNAIPKESAVDKGEAEDAVERPAECDEDRLLTKEAMAASERVLIEIWDNPDDAEYDRL
ncbi:MAG: toxin-antitoxin system, antitoxin component, Xre family protein [Acidobacteriota bacterium]|nr:toxin-antitoxin system, antitoxin component, Xre family protein [Acidobacteriota bacterium]